MTSASDWLAERLDSVPERLDARMRAAVAPLVAPAPVHETLARAAEACLSRALHTDRTDSALDLLAADALMTHACEAAAELGSDTLSAFVAAWTPTRFERLLSQDSQ